MLIFIIGVKMKLHNLILLILILISQIQSKQRNEFLIKSYTFKITNSWDARLIKVQARSQAVYQSDKSKISIEIKKQNASIEDKKKGYAFISFKDLSMALRSIKNKTLKEIKYSLEFLFERKGKQFKIEIAYPFYLRNLENIELFAKLPTHHRILRRRLDGLAFDLTSEEQKTSKIFNEKRRDWLECSDYLINESDSLFHQTFRSRYETLNENK